MFLRSCASCHGTDARGGDRGLGLSPPPRDLTDPALHASLDDDALRQRIRLGKGMMPAFGGMLAEEDVQALIVFLRSLPKGAAEAAPP